MALLDRIASAPTSRGICEVPGWGHMLPTQRVLTDMTELGISATEYDAPGSHTDPEDIRGVLDGHAMGTCPWGPASRSRGPGGKSPCAPPGRPSGSRWGGEASADHGQDPMAAASGRVTR